MIFVNLGCGGMRPPHLVPSGFVNDDPSPWINVDNLYSVLTNPEEPALLNLKEEDNYINCDLKDGITLDDNYADGVLMNHFLEHLNCQECLKLLRECHRILKPEGVIRISVPDAKKFYEMSLAEKLGQRVNWGQRCPHPEMTFMEWALFFFEHKQVLGYFGVACMLLQVGFNDIHELNSGDTMLKGLEALDRSPEFSVFVEARKNE